MTPPPGPGDLSLADLQQVLCIGVGVHSDVIADAEMFPGPDRRDAQGLPYWTRRGVATWAMQFGYCQAACHVLDAADTARELLASGRCRGMPEERIRWVLMRRSAVRFAARVEAVLGV